MSGGAAAARRRLLPSFVSCLVGCTPGAAREPSHAPGAELANPATSELERFLPLRDGHVLSYRVWLGGADTPEQVIFQVERRTPTRASLRAGNSTKQLEIDRRGVRLVSGGYLLVPPLELGAEWMGAAGRVEVTATGLGLDVPAGRFDGCLETTEADVQSRPPRSIVTTYCPGVGIARIEVDDGERQERFELSSFGPRVDIDAL